MVSNIIEAMSDFLTIPEILEQYLSPSYFFECILLFVFSNGFHCEGLELN